MKATDPNCLKCVFFQVTWNENHPRSCLKFHFKSKELPSVVVRQSTGVACPHFTSKFARSADTPTKNGG